MRLDKRHSILADYSEAKKLISPEDLVETFRWTFSEAMEVLCLDYHLRNNNMYILVFHKGFEVERRPLFEAFPREYIYCRWCERMVKPDELAYRFEFDYNEGEQI